MSISIYTFLSDNFQQTLKQRAERKGERFEELMEHYKDVFVDTPFLGQL